MRSSKPIKRRSPLARGQPLKRSGFATRTKPVDTARPAKSASGNHKKSKRTSKRMVDDAHVTFVRSLPCLVCRGPSTAHHVLRTPERAAARKSDDNHTLPLCHPHHMRLHDSGNETRYLHEAAGLTQISPVELSEKLFEVSRKYNAALAIITSYCGKGSGGTLESTVLLD